MKNRLFRKEKKFFYREKSLDENELDEIILHSNA
jgi:hypothetical protein